MTVTFKTADIPVITKREKTPNPFAPHADAAIQARGTANDKGEYPDAKAILFELDTDGFETDDKSTASAKAEKYMTRKIREAGAEKSVTIRVQLLDDKKTVKAWAIDRITREKKSDGPTA